MQTLLILLSVNLLVMSVATAKPVYFNQLRSQYANVPEVGQRRCQNCHSKSSLKLNAYGKDFVKAKSELSSVKDAFIALEELDSDGDGVDNLSEIESGEDPSK